MLALAVPPEGPVWSVVLDDAAVLAGLYAAIGCDRVDVVSLAGDVDMWLDDEGLLVAEPVFNPRATFIAERFGVDDQPYCGVAVFTGGVGSDGRTESLSTARAVLLRNLADEVEL
jgi:hypothetical protein